MLNFSKSLQVLIEEIAESCKSKGFRLAAAESCTGGLVSATLTSIPGSSNWFDSGFVTYSNNAKQKMIGVSPETLLKHGAVSEETAKEMAEGALTKAEADIAVSITGIAGPDGGTNEKPVGTVCFGWAQKGQKTQTETRHFSGDRATVRDVSLHFTLQHLSELLA